MVDRGKTPTRRRRVSSTGLRSRSDGNMRSRLTSAATPGTERIRAIIMKTLPSNAKRRFAEVAPCPNELAYQQLASA